MATAIIGESFTFQVLFVDELNAALAVTSPAITVFYFDSGGTKQVLVDGAAMSDPTVAETGRYIYAYTIPGTFNHGQVIYAEFAGVDPETSLPMLSEQTIDLITASSGSGSMVARFVQGG